MGISRRQFLRTGAVIAGGAQLGPALAPGAVKAQGWLATQLQLQVSGLSCRMQETSATSPATARDLPGTTGFPPPH